MENPREGMFHREITTCEVPQFLSVPESSHGIEKQLFSAWLL